MWRLGWFKLTFTREGVDPRVPQDADSEIDVVLNFTKALSASAPPVRLNWGSTWPEILKYNGWETWRHFTGQTDRQVSTSVPRYPVNVSKSSSVIGSWSFVGVGKACSVDSPSPWYSPVKQRRLTPPSASTPQHKHVSVTTQSSCIHNNVYLSNDKSELPSTA